MTSGRFAFFVFYAPTDISGACEGERIHIFNIAAMSPKVKEKWKFCVKKTITNKDRELVFYLCQSNLLLLNNKCRHRIQNF